MDRVLSPDLRQCLSRYGDRRLVIITNDTGAGLPWEFMSGDHGDPLGKRQGIVRRITLSGPARDPGAVVRTGARLRLLLVVNPLGDLLSTVPEANQIEAALRGWPDIEVVRVEQAAATLQRLEQELATRGYDVLHYAGHVFFDPDDPARSGLKLPGDDVLTAAQFVAAQPRGSFT